MLNFDRWTIEKLGNGYILYAPEKPGLYRPTKVEALRELERDINQAIIRELEGESHAA